MQHPHGIAVVSRGRGGEITGRQQRQGVDDVDDDIRGVRAGAVAVLCIVERGRHEAGSGRIDELRIGRGGGERGRLREDRNVHEHVVAIHCRWQFGAQDLVAELLRGQRLAVDLRVLHDAGHDEPRRGLHGGVHARLREIAPADLDDAEDRKKQRQRNDGEFDRRPAAPVGGETAERARGAMGRRIRRGWFEDCGGMVNLEDALGCVELTLHRA